VEDLSLHILDLAENSIEAGASKIEIIIRENTKTDWLTIEIIDNGKGMSPEVLKRALDPFFTTKTVRRVGLGLSLFKDAAQEAGGDLTIQSKVGQGTKLKATFQLSHIDRKPMGSLTQTLMTLIIGHPEIRFIYSYQKNGQVKRFDSAALAKDQDLTTIGTVELVALVRKHLEDL
jgi:anti-sigma regulatory factor (Ser/Thr protein kinase)